MIAPDGESNIIPHHHFMIFVTLTLHNAYRLQMACQQPKKNQKFRILLW